MLNVKDLFIKYEADFLKYETIPIERRLSSRRDLNAFLLLDNLVPSTRNDGYSDTIVAAAAHDEIYLDVNLEDLAKVATEEQIADLIRSGVRYNKGTNSLQMFV